MTRTMRMTGALLGIVALAVLAGCGRTETVSGKVTRQMMLAGDEAWTLREAIELEDRILILEFSDATKFDANMKSLPSPSQRGFYVTPPEEEPIGAVQMGNGEIIYFRGDKEYEATGMPREMDKSSLAFGDPTTKKVQLLVVKKIRMR